ncbi:hypothetical protein WMY93_020652 [Mugilogobius chulae]|uniref:Tyrosine specific protein phosphatases domain-containing protein n=1 Tax=Mugilogobius chulae TaxID=88201 RepID=A0AAW0N8E8_9GOBI
MSGAVRAPDAGTSCGPAGGHPGRRAHAQDYSTTPGGTMFSTTPGDSVRDSSGRVLVHCQAGISRSATICLVLDEEEARAPGRGLRVCSRRRSIISRTSASWASSCSSSRSSWPVLRSEAAATASPLLAPKSAANTSAAATPTSPFIFSFPVSVVNPVYLHHNPITTSPGC